MNYPRKTVTLNIPTWLKNVLVEQVEGKHLSGKIREVLSWSGSLDDIEALPLDYSSLAVPQTESHKHNLLMSTSQFQENEHRASSLGMSLSNRINMLLAYNLTYSPEIDFELPPFFTGWDEIDFTADKYSAREQAPRFRVYADGIAKLEELGITRPIPLATIQESVNLYLTMSLKFKGQVNVNLTGYFFQARHNKKSMSLKLPLPPYYENVLEELGHRSLISKGAMLVKVLCFAQNYNRAIEEFIEP